MIESGPIPAGINNYLKICLIEDDYRIRVTDLFGTIMFELEKDEINKFYQTFTTILLSIQELKTLEHKKELLKNSIKNNSPASEIRMNEESKASINVNDGLFLAPTTVSSTVDHNQIQQKPLELIDLYPKLTKLDLQQCIKAIQEEKKLSRKVTIDGTDLEEFVLQAFDGQKITLSKIINQSANCSISLLKDSLRRTLDGMVQEGKISSTQERNKQGIDYILYSINYTQTTQKNTLDILLEKLGKEFSSTKFVEEALKIGVNEQSALSMLENGYQNGDLMEIRPQTYKKIE